MKFDWYQATIEAEPDYIKSAFMEASGGDWEWSPPMVGSDRTETLVVDGEPLLELCTGGRFVHPHTKATGSSAHLASAVIRTACPEHLVSRADVCVDLEAPGWFDHAFSVMRDHAVSKGTKTERVGDWDGPHPARTFRVGSKSSPVMMRLYEKGMEQRAKDPRNADSYSPDWVRLEVQVRPSKRANKLDMAGRPLSDFWGAAKWSRNLATQLLDVEVPKYSMVPAYNGRADLEQREHFMVQQYGRTLRERAAIEGSPEAFGHYLDRMLRQYEAIRN